MTKIRLMTLALVVLAAQAAPFAQEQVTVVRRNGDKVSGRFEDWVKTNDTVYIRVTQDDQRRIPSGRGAKGIRAAFQQAQRHLLGAARGPLAALAGEQETRESAAAADRLATVEQALQLL